MGALVTHYSFNLIHLTYLFIFAAICKTGRCRITVLSCNLMWVRSEFGMEQK